MINRLKEHRGLLVAVLIAAAVYALYRAGVIPKLPDAKKLIENVATTLGQWTYLLVGGLAFLETGAGIGLIAPGETAVLVGGVVAGQGTISLIPLLGLVWVAAVLGDTTSFFIGRRLGREFLLKHGPKVKITADRLAQVESYFERHGGKTILIGRFIGLVRALAPFIAGSSGLEYRRFVPFSIIGCGLWASLYTLLGFVFYQSFDKVAGYAGRATLVFAVAVGLAVAIAILVRRLRDPEQRARIAAWLERQGDRPLLRPLAAVVRPAWRAAAPRLRFLGRRLTPGDLGLELTTTAAVAATGFYVFVLYAVILGGGTVMTPFDHQGLDLAGALRTSWGVDLAKVVSGFGSFTAVATLSVITAVALAARRRVAEAWTIAIGLALLFAAVQLAKNGVDRPRPPAPLTGSRGSSYPSGHAAYSTVYVAVAAVVARAVPGIASRATLITVALAVAAAIGLSRIYLRVHYWSDVAGGWGLGAGVLGLCAAVAIVVSYVRNNGAARSAP